MDGSGGFVRAQQRHLNVLKLTSCIAEINLSFFVVFFKVTYLF